MDLFNWKQYINNYPDLKEVSKQNFRQLDILPITVFWKKELTVIYNFIHLIQNNKKIFYLQMQEMKIV